MSAHTPGPWEVSIAPTEDNGCVIVGPNGRTICECYADGEEQDEEDRCNAQHIVRCVNAHDDLLAALRECMAVVVAGTQLDRANAYAKAYVVSWLAERKR